MSHLNSQQFMRMLADGEAGDWLSGDYHFSTLGSGLSVHGGSFTAKQDLRLSRLVPPYISFIILFDGELDFSLNQYRQHVYADGGKVLLIATARESLFCRYLHAGQSTRKLTVKGVEHWLRHCACEHYLPAIYGSAVRCWPLGEDIAALARNCLFPAGQAAAEGDAFSSALQREIALLQLLAALWRDYGARFPLSVATGAGTSPDDAFASRLNAAFAGGARQTGELAAALFMSERTLQRRLHEHFDLTVGEWLRHKHMQYALQALTTGQDSIGEIAWRCGYRQSSAFIQAFKRHFGCTPAKIRQQSREP